MGERGLASGIGIVSARASLRFTVIEEATMIEASLFEWIAVLMVGVVAAAVLLQALGK